MSGFNAWVLQRFSAVYMLLFLLIAMPYFIVMMPWDATRWQALFASFWVQVAVFLFYLSLLLHAWVGLRDVFMDYIHHWFVRLLLLVALAFFLLAHGFWLLRILFQLPAVSGIA
jgi:succinate dehydrogenase / fumarate reductase membrane anchor subunit